MTETAWAVSLTDGFYGNLCDFRKNTLTRRFFRRKAAKPARRPELEWHENKVFSQPIKPRRAGCRFHYLTYNVLYGIAESKPRGQTSRACADVGSRLKVWQLAHLQERVI